ncbi:phage shock protein A (PspA) family protein [Pseudorhodobacter antarcticus]|jgi:phage shock protein A|uniref:Phage shock protein A (PspA) family protein n=1 Tax=Pseudorhodobacter antarcticus TaxID=1077947 RepID=A0A1H8CLQ8_9RHOB|nr:PspA/IM30 family protein [Pseudorhodobacter antarcticus]SEM95852.1 phage shock protein A (PspA) family protein [Pseudorhodobacter antarcticus]
MFGTLRTLILGANARAEDTLRDTYAIELIDQKIREADEGLRAAKGTLASLIQRQRAEERMLATLDQRITDMTRRATDALATGRDDLAVPAADALAQMENERVLRSETVLRLETKTVRLRQSVEAGHHRIIDLKQGATTARAIRREQSLIKKLPNGDASAIEEAEALIARVTNADDPFERSDILRGINRELSHDGLADRMADAGFGPATRITAADVLARLQSKTV